MDWIQFKSGEFAKCVHGCYFVYSKFNREMGLDLWFAEYQAWVVPRTQGKPITDRRFESLEEVRRFCEQHARRIGH